MKTPEIELYRRIREMGVNRGYASQISRGIRHPSLPLAIRIYRAIGEKLGPIADKTDAEIRTLERVGATRISGVS